MVESVSPGRPTGSPLAMFWISWRPAETGGAGRKTSYCSFGIKSTRLLPRLSTGLHLRTSCFAGTIPTAPGDASNVVGQGSRRALFFTGYVHFSANRRKRGALQNPRDRIPDFLHNDPGPTCFDVDAFIALAKPGFAGAGQRRQRSLDHADYGRKRNLVRRMHQYVAASLALLTRYQPQAFQREQDLLQKLLGYGFALR